MGLTSLSTQLAVILGSFSFLVLFHWYLLYICKSKWITSIPTKSICLFNASIFAFICGFGGLYVWLNPTPEQIMHPLHGTNLFQEYVCLIGCGYFIYDILIVLFIDPTIAYLLHAVLGGLFAYIGGVIPLASHSGSFVMAYEISTPFKNLRYLMIKWGYSKSIFFRFVEILFILSFIYIRLIIGLPAMYNVTDHFLRELDSLYSLNKEENYFRLYSTYFLLYGGWANVILNVYWSYAIFKAIIVFGKHKGDYTPNDENEIVYDSHENICGNECAEIEEIPLELNPQSSSLITEGDKLYFGRLYFRNAPETGNNILTELSKQKQEIHIDVYQNNMSKTYYKCDIGAIFMNLNHNFKSKQWFKYLLCWDRNSHFGDIQKPLIYSVKKLLYFYSKNALIKNGHSDSDYYRKALEDIKYGNIYLFTLLKTVGIGWNPISVYYCYDDANTTLVCLLFEMINVPWSKRHIYILPIRAFGQYNAQEKQWIIEMRKICPFSPMDFTHFNGNPKGYNITANNPLNTAENNGILQIHGHCFSFMDQKDNTDANKVTKPDLIHYHKWGTSSCIIPKQKRTQNNTQITSPVIEFGLHKCTETELNSYNLLYLVIWYPFSSFVLRFQLYLFIIVNWCMSMKSVKTKKSHSKYSNLYKSYFQKKLSYFEVMAEIFKICIGGFCFLFITVWNIIEHCRQATLQRQSNS